MVRDAERDGQAPGVAGAAGCGGDLGLSVTCAGFGGDLGLSVTCAGFGVDLGLSVTCDRAGVVAVVWAFILAMAANQSTYQISPKAGSEDEFEPIP